MKKTSRRIHIAYAERGYDPAEWFIPILYKILKREHYVDHIEVTRTKGVPHSAFPLLAIGGNRSSLIDMESAYQVEVKSMFHGMGYDDLKRLSVGQIQDEFIKRNPIT